VKKFSFLTLLFFLSSYFVIYSQNFIEGTIYYEDSSGDKFKLSGVSVFWENTSIGTLSDINGGFKISTSTFLIILFLNF
jgi:hypothetical protein